MQGKCKKVFPDLCYIIVKFISHLGTISLLIVDVKDLISTFVCLLQIINKLKFAINKVIVMKKVKIIIYNDFE